MKNPVYTLWACVRYTIARKVEQPLDAQTAAQVIEIAERQDEVTYVEAVTRVLTEAIRLLDKGNESAAIALFKVIADLDIDDRLIEIAVDDARNFLEARHIDTPPSSKRGYQEYLAKLPPRERHMMLARQCISELGGRPDPARAKEIRNEAITHFEQARSLAPLSEKDERVYMGLKQKGELWHGSKKLP